MSRDFIPCRRNYYEHPYKYRGIIDFSREMNADEIRESINGYSPISTSEMYIYDRDTGEECAFNLEAFEKFSKKIEERIKREIEKDKYQKELMRDSVFPFMYDEKYGEFVAKSPKRGWTRDGIKKYEYWYLSFVWMLPLAKFVSMFFNDVSGVYIGFAIWYLYGCYWSIIYNKYKDR